MNSYTRGPYTENKNATAPDFGKVYDRADFTKMFLLVYGTQKKIV